MKLALWKRTVLAGLLTLTMAGGAIAATTPADARENTCPDGYTLVRRNGTWWCLVLAH